MAKTKIYAAYLPQYHKIPENDRFWGESFTDWDGVKNAKPAFDGHKQPRVPLDKRYYDLSDINQIKWQANLAKQYGISGFNIYHYWFKDGHKVLEKPAELLLNDKTINIGFFFSWDNNSWKRTWSNIDNNSKKNTETLLELSYGDEKDWKQHFDYLLPFFKDSRYLRIDGKPVFVLMKTEGSDILKQMKKYWDKLAIENGLPGVYMITGSRVFFNKADLDASFVYQPRFSAWGKREFIESKLNKYLGIKFKKQHGVKYFYDYSKVWNRIIKHAKANINKNVYSCGLVGFDDTPRRGDNARIVGNSTPKLFEKYFRELYRISCKANKELLFLTAWNEWGEGAYLEPDEDNGYAYLEALKRAINMESE